MASFSSTAFSTNAFSVNAFDFGVGPVVHRDTHDDAERHRKHTDAERKRTEEYRAAREALQAQITEAYEIATGEYRAPEPEELPALEKRAGQLPKAERPAYRRTILQIRNWQAELAEIDRVLIALDDQDFEDLIALL